MTTKTRILAAALRWVNGAIVAMIAAAVLSVSSLFVPALAVAVTPLTFVALVCMSMAAVVTFRATRLQTNDASES